MQFNLYDCSDDIKVINKSPTLIGTLDNVHWKEGTSVLQPVFTFRKNDFWQQFNYVGIKWNKFPWRYYFVKKLVAQPGGIVEVYCEEDVRYTWKDEILSKTLLISRQENIYNKALPDDRKPIPLGTQLNSYEIGQVGEYGSGADGTIILTVSGGELRNA